MLGTVQALTTAVTKMEKILAIMKYTLMGDTIHNTYLICIYRLELYVTEERGKGRERDRWEEGNREASMNR